MKKFLLMLAVMLLTCATSFAERTWLRPEAQPVQTDAEQYFYNVEYGGFLCGANDWGTRASVARDKGLMLTVTQTPSGFQFGQMSPDNTDGVWVDGNRAGNDQFIFLHLGDDRFNIMNGKFEMMFLTWTGDEGNTRLNFTESPANGTWYSVSEEEFNRYMAEDLESVKLYFAALPLKDLLEKSSELNIDDSSERAVYNNDEATIEQLNAAIASLTAKLKEAQDKIDEENGIFTGRIVNNTVTGATGWTCERPVGGNGPMLNGTAFEYWGGNASSRQDAAFNYYQKIAGLPAGKYVLGAEMKNSSNGEGEGHEPNGNAGLYIANGETEKFIGVTEDGEELLPYTTQEIAVNEGDEITVGVKSIGYMSARWFVADNFTLTRTGDLPGDAIAFDVVDPDVSASEIWNIYENEDYKLYIDITKNLPLDPTRTYTLEDMDASYSYIYSKNEVITNSFGTKNWKQYNFTSISVKVGENNELEAIVEAKNGEDVISGTFVFDNPDPITVTLDGEAEYIANTAYAVSAKNIGSEVKADYSVQFGIKEASYESKTTFTKDDLMANGNSIRVATKETKITDANITLTTGEESLTFEGTVVGADEKTYAIKVTTNIPSKEAKKETIDFGEILAISEDEGDIKLVAQNDDAKFVGYITVDPVTTDVPSGDYNLLSYTKYGANSDFGYMLDAVEDGKVTVTNNEGEISIVATFKQNNVEYTVTATAAAAPELATVTIEESEGVYTVTSTSADAALYYLCKPTSWLDEGETPESCLQAEIEGMGSMIDSEETWDLYDHMGMKPAPKTFTVADYQEIYAGEEMFIIAANVGWDGEKLGVISNIEKINFTVPAAPAIADGTYFIQNVESGLFMAGNNSWGTQASAVAAGDEFAVTLADGVYTITGTSLTSANKTLGYNLFVDTNVSQNGNTWTIAPVEGEEGVYTIYGKGKKDNTEDAFEGYIAQSETAGAVTGYVLEGVAEITDAAKWRFVTKADLTAEIAAGDNVTYLISNANFTRNHATSAWIVDEGCTNKNLGGGENANFCAESYHSAFNIHQTIENAPNGFYTLTAQGFYRNDFKDGETHETPVFYANGEEIAIPVKTGEENSMSDASRSFTNGLYTIDPIQFEVTDGTITIGVKSDEAEYWCIWDNFQLTYLGEEAPAEIAVTLVANDSVEYLLNTHSVVTIDQPISAIKVAGLDQVMDSVTYAIYGMDKATLAAGLLSVNTIGYAEFAPVTLYEGNQYNVVVTVGENTVFDQIVIGAAEPAEIEIAATINDSIALNTHSAISAESIKAIEVSFDGFTPTQAGFSINTLVQVADSAAEASSWEIGETLAQGELSLNGKGYVELEEAIVLNAGTKYCVIINAGNESATFEINGAYEDPNAINSIATASKANGKYIENGKVVIVKNGVKYNVAGSIIK